MRIGDHPDARELRANDDSTCPQCGGRKNPGFDLCRQCAQKQRQGGGSRADRGRRREHPSAADRLPDHLIFSDSFYNEAGKLNDSIFYEYPEEVANLFQEAGIGPNALRAVYQAFLTFAGALRDDRMDFAVARERFGEFFVERIVRQVNRDVLKPILHDFFERHRELALSGREEMLALFRYFTNVYCYFGDTNK